jgi:hypothetical protein
MPLSKVIRLGMVRFNTYKIGLRIPLFSTAEKPILGLSTNLTPVPFK